MTKRENLQNEAERYEDEQGSDSDLDVSFVGYDVSASPNDFNVRTLFDFVERGIFNIPGFQRNYVWDIRRASKLVESLLIGIPIPQIFLYEEARNSFVVIDGQQRLLTTYFFIKKRFPLQEKRFELREIFTKKSNTFPGDVLSDDAYFKDFNLSLPERLPEHPNKFNRKNYSTLSEDDRTMLDLRTIRNIVIKQNSPDDGDSVVFEIFNRLNTGGVNLNPQEIRISLYHSKFYDMLYHINLSPAWRQLVSKEAPDANMKDVEVLLRGFAMLIEHDSYQPSLKKFLNSFSLKAKTFPDEEIERLRCLFEQFAKKCLEFNRKLFLSEKGRFNIALYEAIFVALAEPVHQRKSHTIQDLDDKRIQSLKTDSSFLDAIQKNTASAKNVKTRICKAKELL